MLSSDESVFNKNKEDNQTILRLSRYLDLINKDDPFSSINDLVYTRFPSNLFSPVNGLNFVPIQSKRIQFFPIKGYLYAENKLRNIRLDLITSQNPFEIGILGLILKRKFDIPLEVQIHLNYFSPYWLKEHNFYNRVRFYMAKVVIKNADKIRVVSSSIQEGLVKKWGLSSKRIQIAPVPVFINDIYFEKNNPLPLDKSDNKKILFVGRLAYQKNLPTLLKICQATLLSFNNLEFMIIGDGPLRKYVQTKAREIHPNQIKLLGTLPHSQLFDWYKKADLFLLPSYYEGLPRVVVESYLFKVPAIGSNTAGLEDIIFNGQTGFIVNVEDIEEFTKSISWMLNHSEEARNMGIRGYEFVRSRFDPLLLTKNIVDGWRQLVNSDEHDHGHSQINTR